MNGTEKILNSLWILASFVLVFNGFGFVYIGSKTGNRKWILEGIIYELPWIALMMEIGLVENPGTSIVSIGMLMTLVSIIRSIYVNPKYHDALSNSRYRKSTNRLFSLLMLIISAVPIINGIPMIYTGFSNSNKDRIYEGIIYELPWILLFIFVDNEFISKASLMIGFCLIIVSSIRYIMVNYEMDSLSQRVYPISNIQNAAESPIMKNEPVAQSKSDVSANEKSPYKDKLPEINSLSDEFESKEKKVSQLVEKRFKSSEMTHDKFKSVISSAHENFYIQRNSALEIINLSIERNEKIDNELSKRIDALKSILAKVNQLIEALIIDSLESKDAEEDFNNLVDDMEELISSVKDYN